MAKKIRRFIKKRRRFFYGIDKHNNPVTLVRRFFCGIDKHNNPVTLVKTSQGNIIIITWTGKYAKDRCNFVSRRFEELYKKGSLKYFKSGKFKGYNVICGVSKPDEECLKEEQILIYLAPEEDSKVIVQGLQDIGMRWGAWGAATVDTIMESSATGSSIILGGSLLGDPTTDAPGPEKLDSD